MCAAARATAMLILLSLGCMAWVIGPASPARARTHAAADLQPSSVSARTTVRLEPSSANATSVAAPSFEVGDAPDWIVDVGVPDDAGVSSDLLHDGVADLLSDQQVRIGAEPEHAFRRNVAEVIEPSGVSNVGRIQIGFAATYQSLVLHWVRLVRDGEVQERLDPSKVRLIEQEEDLDLDLFHHSATALLILDDVRVGDRVDYAYSIVGTNPIFDGRHMDRHYLEWWYPIGRIHNRIVTPAGRPLYIKPHQTDVMPEVRSVEGSPGLIEYIWQGERIEAALHEGQSPADHDPLASHQFSEFETWAEVAHWASDVFDIDGTSGPGVRVRADEIRSHYETDAERIIATLRFVQDEVRYLGLEIGVNAYRPHAPELTLERRFGDCKDKSSLVVAMLAELDIEAHVALVNTELGPAVTRLHPTANAFDHAIVRVQHAGRSYWVDPTASYERGPLEDEEWFDYGAALVVEPSSEGLTVVEPDVADLVPARIEHIYTTTAYTEPTRLDVTSTYRGNRADSFRSFAATTATDSIERQYQNYYARDLPQIERAKSIQIEDDETTNTIIVSERYQVPRFWEWDGDEGRHQAVFIARELRSELSRPDTVQREHPLDVSHPVHDELTLRIITPEPMRIRTIDERVEGPAFTLDRDVRRDGDTVVIEYVYRSTANRVAPEDVAAHLEAVEDAWGVTDYWLQSSAIEGGGAGEPGGQRHRVDLWARQAVFLALVTITALFFALPRWLLRSAQRHFDRGDNAGAAFRLRLAARAAPPRSTLGRQAVLALSVTLGIWGREDEALGHAAWLSRLDAHTLRDRAIRAAALAWRARLVAGTAPERAMGFAHTAVDLARELPGALGWDTLLCTLSMRGRLYVGHGAVEESVRDLEEARSDRVDTRPRPSGLASLLRVISSCERAELDLAMARLSGDALTRESQRLAEHIAEPWPTDHAVVLDVSIAYASVLLRTGRGPEAGQMLDRVESGIDTRIDSESSLHRRAATLREELSQLD